MRKEVILPLFLHVTDPLGIIVANDRLIDVHLSGGLCLYPDKALFLLFELYKSPVRDKAIPSIIHSHFENDSLKKHALKSNCLVGIDESYEPGALALCLNLSMIIQPSKDCDVLLKNVTYKRNPIDAEVYLSASEAFYILANICVEQVFPTLCLANRISTKTTNFSKDSLSKLEDDSHYKHMRSLFHFVADYIEHLQELIESDNLSPAELLRLGGISSLMLLIGLKKVNAYVDFVIKQIGNNMKDLTSQQRIQYYSFTRCLYTEARERFPALRKIYSENKNLSFTVGRYFNYDDMGFLYEEKK